MALKLPIPKIPKHGVKEWLPQSGPVQKWIADRLTRQYEDSSGYVFPAGEKVFITSPVRHSKKYAQDVIDMITHAFNKGYYEKVNSYYEKDNGE